MVLLASSHQRIQAIIWVFSGIALAFLTSRILIRLRLNGRLKIDDSLVILAMICLLVSNIVNSVMSSKTFIVQSVRIDHEEKPANFEEISASYAKYQWAIAYLFFTGIWAVKGSFLAYYDGLTRRLPNFRRAWWATIVVTILTYIGCLLAYAFLDGLRFKQNLRNEAINYQFSADFTTDVLSMYLDGTQLIEAYDKFPSYTDTAYAGIEEPSTTETESDFGRCIQPQLNHNRLLDRPLCAELSKPGTNRTQLAYSLVCHRARSLCERRMFGKL